MYLVKVKAPDKRTKEYYYKTEKRARKAIEVKKAADPDISFRLFEELSVSIEQPSLDLDYLDF